MKTLTNRVFISALALFAMYHLVPFQPDFPLIHSYLDDLLSLPLILTLILFAHRSIRISSDAFTLPRSHIVLSLVLIAGVFELLLPQIAPRFTADIYDVIAYSGGAAIFDLLINV